MLYEFKNTADLALIRALREARVSRVATLDNAGLDLMVIPKAAKHSAEAMQTCTSPGNAWIWS